MVRGILVILSILIGACGHHAPRYPELANRQLYLCCNLWVSRRNTAGDANYSSYYAERDGAMIPAGTRVAVLEDGENELKLSFQGMTEPFSFGYRYGRDVMPAGQYFRLLLLENNPRRSLDGAPPEVISAVNDGQLIPGMTKEQAIIARGYPPFHHTPGIQANEWLYYASPGFVDRVRFVDDRIEKIEREDAPTH